MGQKKTNNDTIKRIILVIASVGVGTFIMNILLNTDIYIWFARGVGALVTAIVALFLHHILIKNTRK